MASWPAYIVAVVARRFLILPDAHFPHHDRTAMAVVAHVSKVWKPDTTVILGDWLDCEGFSSHPRSSVLEAPPSYLADEVAPCNAMLDVLQGRSDRPLVYLAGNHEYRVERMALQIGDQWGHDMWKLMSPERLLTHRVNAKGACGATRKNFTWIDYLGSGTQAHYAITPDLIAVHGWSHSSNAAARHMALGRGLSVVFGHVHRSQWVSARAPLTGKLIQSWSPGCLSQLIPYWHASTPSDWTQGFSLVYVGTRSWTAYNVPIHPGGWCVLPDGTEVQG